jgi:selenocysteine lyase/cysteine desulfurase
VKFEDDLYVIDEIYQSYLKDYWNGKRTEAIHFNHASITAPLPFIHQAALEMQKKKLSLNSPNRASIIEDTRGKVATLANLHAENVVFANNTTDAASLVFWLVGLEKGDSVITTDAENESIPRIFRYYMDHANPGDGWTSWQNFAQYSNSHPGLIKKQPTGVKVDVVEAYGITDDVFLKNLLKRINDSTKLVVFCHVLRENGRILPVRNICESIRQISPQIYILVDGAQCLGTIPEIDLQKLGCDFYVATPHKTLSTETTGILFIQPSCLPLCSKISSVPRKRQIIKKDQFGEELKIRPNSRYAVSLPEIYALSLVIDYYRKMGWARGNDFSAIDKHLGTLKRSLIQRLRGPKVKIESPQTRDFTNFICSFRLDSVDNRHIVRNLWSKKIFLSYISRSNVIRTSFSTSNTPKEIERFRSELSKQMPHTNNELQS